MQRIQLYFDLFVVSCFIPLESFYSFGDVTIASESSSVNLAPLPGIGDH